MTGSIKSPTKVSCAETERTPYLVEEVLHELRYPDVIQVPVDKKHLLQVLKLGYCIVAVPCSLATLLPNDA